MKTYALPSCKLGRTVLVVGLIVSALPATVFAQGMPPMLVETEPVTSMEFHNQVTLVGRTKAMATSRIVAAIAGQVIRIDSQEGVWVPRGHLLVSIDPDKTRYALEAKRAEASQAKAQAELAEKNLERTRDLFDQGLVSDGKLDEDTAEATRAQAWFDQKVAEVKGLEIDLRNCSIRAPYEGYTGKKLTDIGQWVNPGTPVYEMVDLRFVRVRVDLPERYFGHVEIDTEVSIIISSDADNPLTGVVTGISPSATQETHTFPVIVTVDNSEGRLGGGMLVRARLSLDEVFSSLSVNKDAIVRQGAQTMVYTIADGKAVPIPVTTGSTSGQMVAVQGEGLVEGMPVVVRGNERIFPGSAVRTPEGTTDGGEEAGEESEQQTEQQSSETGQNETTESDTQGG